jgi:general secretion pathway protein N
MAGSAMSSLGRVCGVGCFWLVATASALGVAQTGQPPSGNPLWGIPLKQLSATRDRPIFSPSRRPPPAAVPVTAAATSLPVQAPKQQERPQLSLIGTIVSGDDGFAIFVDQTTKAPLRIRLGADYRGWMLRQIEARSVTLRKGEEVVMLSFLDPANGQNTPVGADFAKTLPDPPAPLPPLASTAQTTPPFLSPESNALRMQARPHGGSARRRQM